MARNRVEVVIDGQDNLSGVISGITSGFGKTGRAMSMGVTAPLLGMGTAIATISGDFESAMNNVQALSGATGSDLMRLRDQSKELGITTQFSATQAAEAQGLLAQAGFDTEETLGLMPSVLNMAAAGNMELAQSADIAVTAMTGFQLPLSETPRALDTLAFAANSTNTDISDLGVAFRYVAPVAANMGQSLEHTSLALGMLSNAGIQGSMAGTSLRGILKGLAAPTAKAAGLLSDLGINVRDSSGQMLPLVDIMRQFEASSATSADYMELFGQRAGPGMMALLGQGSDALQELIDQEKLAGGTAQRMADIQMQGLNGAVKGMQSAFEGLAIAIADSGFLDFLVQGVSGITGILRYLAALDPSILRVVTVIAGIAAAIGPVLIALGALAASFSAVVALFAGGGALAGVGAAIAGAFGAIAAIGAGPIILAIAALAAGAYLVINNWGAVSGFFQGLWGSIQGILSQVGAFLGGFITGFAANLAPIQAPLQAIGASFQQMWGAIQPMGAALMGLITSLANIGMSIASVTPIAGLIRGIGAAFQGAGLSANGWGQAVGAAVAAVIGAIIRLIGQVTRFPIAFISAGAQVTAALSNLASTAFNAGAQIIQRLIAGIRSQIGALAGAAGEIASQITSFFPGSPVDQGPLTAFNRALSSPGAELMRMFGAGLQTVDLSGYMGSAIAPLSSAPSIAPPSLSSAAPIAPPQGAIAPSSRGGAIFNNVFNISAASGQSPEEIGRQVLAFLEQEYQDYEAGFLI